MHDYSQIPFSYYTIFKLLLFSKLSLSLKYSFRHYYLELKIDKWSNIGTHKLYNQLHYYNKYNKFDP